MRKVELSIWVVQRAPCKPLAHRPTDVSSNLERQAEISSPILTMRTFVNVDATPYPSDLPVDSTCWLITGLIPASPLAYLLYRVFLRYCTVCQQNHLSLFQDLRICLAIVCLYFIFLFSVCGVTHIIVMYPDYWIIINANNDSFLSAGSHIDFRGGLQVANS